MFFIIFVQNYDSVVIASIIMEITLLAVGKTAIPYVVEGIDDYLKRLRHYIRLTLTIVPDIRNKGKLTADLQKQAEGEKILQLIQPQDYVVLLDERGFEATSEEFADILQRQMASGIKRLVFVVGGPYGFSPQVYERADKKMSMSRMTLNHEMVRLFFIEQVYRAMTILRGEPYHHR